ncbi:cytochrome P450 [Pseudonocardia adelaidensis]|uniref:Cytochrome P450 n=1 Tax=Pseudonocardia adelaidensis TaxID=648754 RepID=A0ABP9NMR4_9PSEU
MFSIRGWQPHDLADPYPVYRRYRDQDPVQRGDGDAWYVFGFDDVDTVLRSPDFGRGPGAPVNPERAALHRIVQNWLVFLDPPRHTELRRMVSAEFAPAVVAGLRGRIAAIAAELVAHISSTPMVDFVEEFAAPFPVLVISELLGVPAEHRMWLRQRAMWLQEASSARIGHRADGVDRADQAAHDLEEYFGEQLEARRGDPREDLVSLMAGAQQRGEATTEEIVGTCVHLLTAGHETTTNLISKSVLILLDARDLVDRLRSEPELLPVVVDELVRYDPPVQMVSRWAYRDFSLGGKTIRPGDKVVPVIGSANRDPLRFPDPDELRLDRAVGRHSGFGAGIHYCLGANLARTEAEIGLAALLKAMPEMSRADEPVCYGNDIIFHGPVRFPLRARVRV